MCTFTARIFIALGILLTAPDLAHGTVKTFQVEQDKVKIDIPSNWNGVLGLYGIPLMITGPEVGGRRPVITITPSGLYEIPLDPKVLSADQAGYKKWREAWLKQVGGKSIKYYPYRNEAWRGVAAAHSIGYRYQVEDLVFEEHSHYVICKNQMFHLKSLVSADHEKQFSPLVDKAVRSFTCE